MVVFIELVNVTSLQSGVVFIFCISCFLECLQMRGVYHSIYDYPLSQYASHVRLLTICMIVCKVVDKGAV